MPLPLYLSTAAIAVADAALMTATLLTPVGSRAAGATASAAGTAGRAALPPHPSSPDSSTAAISAPTSPTSPSSLDTSGDVRNGRLSAAALERALPPRRGLSPADTTVLFFLVRRDRGSGGVVGVGVSGVSVGELPVGGGVEVDVVLMVLGVPGGCGGKAGGEATLDGVRAVEGRGRGWDAPPVKVVVAT
ncbi:hypothetical protein I4F81_010125 [Pyropia yezoensis]|uniref:Uncharacterized protein n=1 Tax=Pyropia yezoensis TaxID=2788 RepID=A0ACC3CCC4_PYRYE|nr:hypothetical protein I4F81_010125 [Neopyropia yezoensis]